MKLRETNKENEKESIKEEIEKIVEPIFGKNSKDLIERFYDEKDSKELIDLVREMLTDYLGEIRAKILLADLILRVKNMEKRSEV